MSEDVPETPSEETDAEAYGPGPFPPCKVWLFGKFERPPAAGWRDSCEMGGGITVQRYAASGGTTLQQVAA